MFSEDSGNGSSENQILLEKKLEEQSEEFKKYYPLILQDLTSSNEYSDVPEFNERLAKLLEYTLQPADSFRALFTVITYKTLEKPENLTPENIKLANILGWCVNLLEAAGLIVDDALDKADLRHGKPSWYKTKACGGLYTLDFFTLECCCFIILRKYFASHPLYLAMIEEMMDIHYKTGIGETLDNMMTTLDQFTFQHLKALGKYKTGFYTFWLPILMGIYMANAVTEDVKRMCLPIFLEMGDFFNIHDSYMDCFADEGLTGKDMGRDIQEGKCTWLVVVALQRVNSNQRKILEDHYGQPGEKSVKAVRGLYEELGLKKYYTEVMSQSYEKVCNQVDSIPSDPLKKLVHMIARKLYRNETYEIY